MGIKLTKLPELSPENLTESESHLWLLLREREECILQLKDEIARLKLDVQVFKLQLDI